MKTKMKITLFLAALIGMSSLSCVADAKPKPKSEVKTPIWVGPKAKKFKPQPKAAKPPKTPRK